MKAQLFSVLEIVIMFLMVGIVLCLLADIINIPGWAKWTLYVLVLLIYLISISYISALREEFLEKSGYGIKTLERWGARVETDPTTTGGKYTIATLTSAGRKVIVDIIEHKERTICGSTYIAYTRIYTRIRVEHTGKIPCVVEVLKGKINHIRFFDKYAYTEWKRRKWDHRNVPKKVKINGNKVRTAAPKHIVLMVTEWARHVFNDQNIAKLNGILRIEPEQVYFLQEGFLLEGEYLKNSVDSLVNLAEKIEKEY